MRWLMFAILAYITTVLQSSLAPVLDVTGRGWRPDLLLLLACFYALFGRSDRVLIGGWILGMLADLTGLGPVGVHAFAFGLISLTIMRLKGSLPREHPLTHVAVVFLSAIAVNSLDLFAAWWSGQVSGSPAWSSALGSAVFTAAVAPYLYWAVRRFRKGLGLQPPKARSFA